MPEMAAADEQTRPRAMWRFRLCDAVLLLGAGVVAILGNVVAGCIQAAGYRSDPDLLGGMLDLVLKLTLIMLPLLALLGMFLAVWKSGRSRRQYLERVAMCLVVYAAVGLIGVRLYSVNYLDLFMQGFHDRVEHDVDLAALRRWYQDRDRPDGVEVIAADAEELPADIAKLRPVMVSRDDNTVDIIWGSGFGHWGVTIMPEEQQIQDESAYAVLIPVRRGIYVWHDQQ